MLAYIDVLTAMLNRKRFSLDFGELNSLYETDHAKSGSQSVS